MPRKKTPPSPRAPRKADPAKRLAKLDKQYAELLEKAAKVDETRSNVRAGIRMEAERLLGMLGGFTVKPVPAEETARIVGGVVDLLTQVSNTLEPIAQNASGQGHSGGAGERPTDQQDAMRPDRGLGAVIPSNGVVSPAHIPHGRVGSEEAEEAAAFKEDSGRLVAVEAGGEAPPVYVAADDPLAIPDFLKRVPAGE